MAARRQPLRAVAPGEKREPARAKTVAEAAESGTTRELLVAMRSRIAVAMDDPKTPPRELAALSKRLFEVVRDIEAIDARNDEESGGGRSADEAFDASAV